MRVVVTGQLSFRASECHPKLVEKLWRALCFPNPAYVSRLRMGRPVTGVQETIACIRQDDAGWVHIPRGAVTLLREHVRAAGGRLDFDDRRRVHRSELGIRHEVCLRPYQRTAVSAMQRHVQGTILSPCGSGKTQVGVAAIAAIDQPALVLVHTHDLAAQWRERIALLLGRVAGFVAGRTANVQPITVAMVQTLARMDPSTLAELGARFGCVVVDEAHHSPSSTFRSVLAHLPGKYRFGLTATPEREDGLTPLLELCIGPTLFEIEQDELVRLGYLERPEVRFLRSQFTFDYAGPEDHHALMDALVTDPGRNRLIVEQAAADACGGHTVLVLTGRVAHCQHLAERLQSAGVEAGCLTGEVAKSERRRLLDAFRQGALPVLVASTVADEGLDVPRLDRIVLAYPGRAKGRVTQRVGRLMRPHPGKDRPVLYDVVDPFVPPLLRQWQARRRLYRELAGAQKGGNAAA
ncbi:DEAD/DEAH box helicase [Haliangium sp.]|uniref:DEAD/DEAH box helicase n=1 Tax=Haliangium sp. TaxID=2663208 RepID=UPI003D131639